MTYFQGAVDWLASHPHVQVGGIGVIGASKGGEVAFLLGMTTDKVNMFLQPMSYYCCKYGQTIIELLQNFRSFFKKNDTIISMFPK